uniref:Neuropeptide-Like Protein n=1 Tax=Haemonchus contortus TaxID=6289 RepID=A0A7I4Z513_HAECO
MRWFAILFVLTLISARSAVAFPRYRRVYFDDIDMFMRRERSEEEAVSYRHEKPRPLRFGR